MPTEDFHVKYRARQAHLAAVPLALEHARSLLIDFNGQPLADGEAQRDGLTAGELRTLVAEVDRLQALVKQQQRDAAEEQREFQREARSIAAEARWEAQEETRGGHY